MYRRACTPTHCYMSTHPAWTKMDQDYWTLLEYKITQNSFSWKCDNADLCIYVYTKHTKPFPRGMSRAHMMQQRGIFTYFYSILFFSVLIHWHSASWQREVALCSHTVRAYACNDFQSGCASWSELKCDWPFWTQRKREKMESDLLLHWDE